MKDVEVVFAIAVAVILTVILFSIPVLCIKNARRRKKIKKELKKSGCVVNVQMKHFNGLPIAEDSFVEFYVYPDCYKTVANGAEFKLDRTKVIDVCVKTNTEIQKQYVSSVGGAIGGAVLFGPIGAMIGGRAKQKQSRTITNYLIVTYMKDDEIKYIAYELFNVFGGVNKIIQDFKENKPEITTVEL